MFIVTILAITVVSGCCLLAFDYLIWRSQRNRSINPVIPILAYHKVDKKFEFGGTWTTPGQFKRQMEFVKDQGMVTVTISRAVEIIKEGRKDKDKYLCITFDDAYEGLYHYAWPVLKEFGFTATIFVVTDYVGKDNDWDVNWGGRKFRHLGWDQISEMSGAGIEFGSHTKSHQDLRSLDDCALKNELSESKIILEKYLDKNIKTLSYPFGRYNEHVAAAAQDAGYICACSLTRKAIKPQAGFMNLQRCAVYITDNLWSFKSKIYQGSYWFRLQSRWCRIVNFCADGTIMVQKIKKRFIS